MLRALWYFVQIAIVAAAAIWIGTQKGSVNVVWNDYTLSLNLGLFLLAFVLFTLMAVTVFRLIGAVLNMPSGFLRRRRERNRKKGFSALTRGFVALAAGDVKKASALARDARFLLPEETALALMLEAQTARLRGDEVKAKASFEQLLEDKDAAFLGIRGLVQSSMAGGDAMKALYYARLALDKNPKQPWVLKSVYDLELQAGLWDEAYSTLRRAHKYDAIDAVQAESDEVALLMLLADAERTCGHDDAWKDHLKRAVKLKPDFIPSVLALCEYYVQKDRRGKVETLIEKAWKLNPHPLLADMWGRIAPIPTGSDTLKRYRWFEKLVKLNPQSADGHIAAARVAIESGLIGEARAHAERALTLRPTVQAYRLMADIEERSAFQGKEMAVRRNLQKAAEAAPDAVWYCTQTGHVYDRWSAIALPHGAFNTIVWGHPLSHDFGTGSLKSMVYANRNNQSIMGDVLLTP